MISYFFYYQNGVMYKYKLIEIIEEIVYKFTMHKYIPLASVLLSVAFSYYYYRKHNKRCKSKKFEVSENGFTEVVFFTDNNSLCQKHLNNEEDCENDCGLQKLNKLVKYLDSATTSLDVCVFTISSSKLGEIILRKFRQGVAVRVITDDSMAYGDVSQIPLFRKNGIRVRTRVSHYLMHHKYAIIDNKILINGSFNWTQQATFGNWENVVVTSTPKSLIKGFSDHFNELWTKLDA